MLLMFCPTYVLVMTDCQQVVASVCRWHILQIQECLVKYINFAKSYELT